MTGTDRLAGSLRPGEQLQLLLKDAAKVGSLPIRRIGVYSPTPVEHPDRCGHLHSICRVCLPDWQADYFVRRFRHGSQTGYRTVGCRCELCRNVSQQAVCPTED
jgi:hypothetical protein